MTVAAGFSAWLQSDARYQSATVSGAAAAWGNKARSSEIISPFAFQADAASEAARQAQFMAGPFAIDFMDAPGRLADLVGRPIVAKGAGFDYDTGVTVFVLEADETAVSGYTRLTVLRRL